MLESRECCSICCAAELPAIIELPNLPLTGIYMDKKPAEPGAGYDQALLMCTECGHAQLKYQLDPEVMYDTSYSFRTSLSNTARSGTEFFLNFLNTIAGDRKLDRKSVV